nr:MAG: hypothetical protein J07AB56_12930 [Candidatus Nanosalinarum sp. J07AB56]
MKNYDAFQGRVIQDPKNLVGEVAYLESLFYTDASKEIFKLLTGSIQPRSKAVLIKKDVIMQLGGFRHGRLTEDIDFGERFCRNDFEAFKDLRGQPIMEAAPEGLNDWLKHRLKWSTGFLEILKKNSKAADINNNTGFVAAVLVLNLVIFMLGQFFALVMGNNNYHILSPIIVSAVTCLGIRINDKIKKNTETIGTSWIYSAFIFPLMASLIVYSAVKLSMGIEPKWRSIEKQH